LLRLKDPAHAWQAFEDLAVIDCAARALRNRLVSFRMRFASRHAVFPFHEHRGLAGTRDSVMTWAEFDTREYAQKNAFPCSGSNCGRAYFKKRKCEEPEGCKGLREFTSIVSRIPVPPRDDCSPSKALHSR